MGALSSQPCSASTRRSCTVRSCRLFRNRCGCVGSGLRFRRCVLFALVLPCSTHFGVSHGRRGDDTIGSDPFVHAAIEVSIVTVIAPVVVTPFAINNVAKENCSLFLRDATVLFIRRDFRPPIVVVMFLVGFRNMPNLNDSTFGVWMSVLRNGFIWFRLGGWHGESK